MRDINKLIVHCSDSTFGNANRIRGWHINERGWSDIGYHYVIANGKIYKDDEVGKLIQEGLVEVGRPLYKAGAHCKGHNSNSIGICMIGVDKFSEKQYTALIHLVKGLMIQYDLTLEDVYGHYELDTNGKTCPNFNPRELIVKSK